ncbi:copper resistance CopC/CopD family protein [Gemmobacter serpentinus]|uniref:copper resistance CopC/CopD family protein n=1 Tax=Gemmobacter serpentinus TaxID=2652247 RepID=UPI00124C42BD|nr:copper resistance protein CopC [Gemmobacter serpentinus]
MLGLLRSGLFRIGTLHLAALVGVLLVLWAPALQAHAVLQSVTPADGSLLQTAPDALRLRFNEAVRPLSIRLIGPNGAVQDLTAQVPGAAELVIPLEGITQGSHVLSWRVVSDDGHPIPGAMVFSVGEITGATAPEADDGTLYLAIWLARFVMVAGLIVGVGGAAALAWIGGKGGHRSLRLMTIAGLVAAPVYLGLHGLDALGLGFAALVSPAPWLAAAGTSFGPAIALAMLAGLLALGSGRLRGLAWAAMVLLALSFAISGHAGAATPRWLTRPMVFLHLLALLFWIGALIPLAATLRRSEGLRRFSSRIPVALTLLFGSGLALAMIQLGPKPAHWQSAYGAILAAKLGLIALLLALAGWNRWRLTGPVLAGDDEAVARMRRVIGAEVLLSLVILGLTAGWRFTPPPRALAAAEQITAPAFAHLHADPVMAMLSLDPGRSGPTRAEIDLTDAEMAPIEALAVTLHLSQPDQGVERLTRSASHDPATGGWRIDDLLLPLPGLWQLEMEIRLTRFKMIRLQGEIAVE